MDVVNVSAVKTRFGIEHPMPAMESSTAVLQILAQEPEATGRIAFRASKTAPPISFDAKLYKSMLSEFLTSQESRVRVETEYFDLIMSAVPGTLTFRVKEDFPQSIALFDLKKLYKLLQLLRGQDTKFLEMSFWGGQSSLTMSGVCDFGDSEKYLRLIDAANFIANFFDYNDVLYVNAKKIVAINKEVFQMEACLKEKILPQLEVFSDDQIALDENQEIDYFFVGELLFESVRFIAYFIISGECSLVERGRYTLKVKKFSIERKLVLPVGPAGFQQSRDEVLEFIACHEGRPLLVDKHLRHALDSFTG